MNQGEIDEIKCKIVLTHMRDQCIPLFGETIQSVGFANVEYHALPTNFTLEDLRFISESDLIRIAHYIGVEKAATGAKADVEINHIGVSLKSMSAAPAALVNHTNRKGFEFTCHTVGVDIQELDSIIDDYWELRTNGQIAEDTKIIDPLCPFNTHKEYMRPILEYFLFTGTGSKLSRYPAEYLIKITDPLDSTTYEKLSKSEAFDELWPNLIFSLRAKKGMPKNYNPQTYTGNGAESIAKWVRFSSGDYRGALHIRATR